MAVNKGDHVRVTFEGKVQNEWEGGTILVNGHKITFDECVSIEKITKPRKDGYYLVAHNSAYYLPGVYSVLYWDAKYKAWLNKPGGRPCASDSSRMVVSKRIKMLDKEEAAE